MVTSVSLFHPLLQIFGLQVVIQNVRDLVKVFSNLNIKELPEIFANQNVSQSGKI